MEIVQGQNSVRITLLQLAQFVSAMTVPAPNIVVGQQAVTASAAQLPNDVLRNGVWVKAAHTNTGPVYAGNSNVNSGTGYRIDTGEKLFFAVNNANLIYIVGTAADVVFFEGN